MDKQIALEISTSLMSQSAEMLRTYAYTHLASEVFFAMFFFFISMTLWIFRKKMVMDDGFPMGAMLSIPLFSMASLATFLVILPRAMLVVTSPELVGLKLLLGS